VRPYGLKLRSHEWRKHDPHWRKQRYRYHTRKEYGRRAVEKTEAIRELQTWDGLEMVTA
jgi:hypothetical protein